MLANCPAIPAPTLETLRKNKLHGFSEVDGEINYLKRLSLRANLTGTAYNNFVPDLSEKEIVVADYLQKLNKLNRDPTKRMVMQNLFHRFNSVLASLISARSSPISSWPGSLCRKWKPL